MAPLSADSPPSTHAPLPPAPAACQVEKAEKALEQPPRLGKHRFEAPSMAVATSDELAGSLRQVKACPMLAVDRFKSLQKRGLIEPRKAVQRKQGR